MTERRRDRDPQGQLRRRAPGQAARRRRAPFAVFINGVEQREGDDYNIRAGEIVFTRQSSRRRSAPAAGWRCTSASSAPTASETIDLQFNRDGKTELLSTIFRSSRAVDLRKT